MTKRKTFISYYHKDETYKLKFEKLFDSLIVNKSVNDGDIKEDNSDDYTKQLIQKEYLKDTTVLIVLIGPKTRCRKHVDWEISGALNLKVGDHYSGLVGIRLPEHSDYGNGEGSYNSNNIPERLVKNLDSGYAKIYDWTDNVNEIAEIINSAFNRRTSHADKRTNNLPQLKENICN